MAAPTTDATVYVGLYHNALYENGRLSTQGLDVFIPHRLNVNYVTIDRVFDDKKQYPKWEEDLK